METIPQASNQDYFKIEDIPGIQALWDETLGDKDICIAIIDGNVDRSHPCFKGAGLLSVDIFNSEKECDIESVSFQHGTAVASIIFGQHTSSVKGIAPGCRGIVIPIFKDKVEKQISCTQLDLARSISIAVENGANVINISGGEFSTSGKSESILSDTIKKCFEKGVLIIAAAGNDGCECLHVPACESFVLAVGAMDESGKTLEFSNWGNAYNNNGILFPGKNILAALPGNNITLKTGTSFAAPIASGIVGLLLSYMKKKGIKPDGRFVFQTLLKTAIVCDPKSQDDCDRRLLGHINLPDTIKEIKDLCNNLSKAPDKSPSILGLSELENSKYLSNNYQKFSNIKNKGGNKMTQFDQSVQLSDIESSGENSIDPYITQTVSEGINFSDCSCQKNGSTTGEAKSGDCGCNKGDKKPPVMVYAIGTIAHEFKTEANRDAFGQSMNRNPDDIVQLLQYLEGNPEAAEEVIWTLNLDATPIYAIYPFGAFAPVIYSRIIEFVKSQLNGNVQRVSVPGIIAGKINLLSGQEIPVLVPKGQGMFSWSTAALIAAVVGETPKAKDEHLLAEFNSKREGLSNFLDRVYYELRNLGITSQERAINYAATNAFQIGNVFEKSAGNQMELDTIEVERSPVCRPHSDCWDVKLIFFNPTKRIEQARRVYRFTIDVSYVIPVTVGEVRSWNIF